MLTIYGADWCIPCKKAKKFLDTKGIEYEYHDVEQEPEAMDHIQSLGYNGVPVFEDSNGIHWQGLQLDKLVAL